MHIFGSQLITPRREGVWGNVIWCENYQNKVKGKESKKHSCCPRQLELATKFSFWRWHIEEQLHTWKPTLAFSYLECFIIIGFNSPSPDFANYTNKIVISYLLLCSKLPLKSVAWNSNYLLSQTFFWCQQQLRRWFSKHFSWIFSQYNLGISELDQSYRICFQEGSPYMTTSRRSTWSL